MNPLQRMQVGLEVPLPPPLRILTAYLCWISDHTTNAIPKHSPARIAMQLGLGSKEASEAGYVQLGGKVYVWLRELKRLGIVRITWEGPVLDFDRVLRLTGVGRSPHDSTTEAGDDGATR